MNVGNFIWQTSTTNGLSNLTLATNDSFVRFVDKFGTGSGNKFFYGIHNRSATEWEVGIGYMLNATTLVRDSVTESSNANALVNFSTGLKDVVCDVPANFQLLTTQLGTMAFESAANYYTKSIVDTLLAGKSNVGHTHIAADITDFAAAFSAQLATKTTTNLAEGTNLYYTQARFDSAFGSKSTTNLAEGTNLYYTDERAQDAVAAALTDTSTISFSYVDGSNQISANVKVDSINDTHIDWGYGANQVNAYDVPIAILGNPTYTNLQELINVVVSAGIISGGTITNAGGGNINVASGSGLIRVADDDVSELQSFNFPALNGIAIPVNEIRYIGVEYNSGSPQIVSRSTDVWDLDTEFPLGTAVYENGMVFVINRPWKIGDSITNIIERFDSDSYITRDNRFGGLILGETGIRNLTITAGQMLTRLKEFTIPSSDTSATDTFTYYYRDGVGGWTLNDLQTQYSNSFYDDGSGTLSSLGSDKYMSHWVYLTVNNKILVLYGQAQYDTLAELIEFDLPPPSVPIRVADMSILIGRIAAQQGQNTASRIDTAFTSSFTPAIVSDHGMLFGLDHDDHIQYLTTARADTWLATKTTTNLAEGTNLYYTQARFDSAFAAKSTTDLSEGTNLYYTQARFDSAFAAKSTTDLSEGTNLYYTQARFDSAFAAKSTTNLAEGTNLYYTDERVDDRVDALLVMGGGLQKSYNDAGNTITLTSSFGAQLFHIQDQKAQNTDGGTFTSGAWRTRDLNTVITNEISGASLSSNQITLPAGTYWCEWFAPCFEDGNTANVHQSRLQNITDATTIATGQSGCSGNNNTTISNGATRFTIASSKVFEIQHQINASQANNGFGRANNFATEVYSRIRIWKL